MAKMKAALFPQKGQIEMTQREIPEIAEGEALVEVKYAGICGSDVHVWQGHHATATYPRIPGHEFSGVLVEAKGTLRDGLKPGDSVVVQPIWTCGMCEPCITGHDNVCSRLNIFGIHRDGCFAQYIRVPIRKVYKMPEGVSLKMGALVEPLAVAVHDVNRSGLSLGDKTLIIGGGPIGMLIGIVAKHAGAGQVYISEINPFRIDFAQSIGLHTINPATEDLAQKTVEITGGKGFDVVFEVSGSKAGIAAMTQTAKIGGTIMVVGMGSESFPVDTGTVIAKELKMKGVRIHAQKHFEAAVELLKDAGIREQLDKLITRVFPLNECVEAMHYQVEDPEHFKVVLEI